MVKCFWAITEFYFLREICIIFLRNLSLGKDGNSSFPDVELNFIYCVWDSSLFLLEDKDFTGELIAIKFLPSINYIAQGILYPILYCSRANCGRVLNERTGRSWGPESRNMISTQWS